MKGFNRPRKLAIAKNNDNNIAITGLSETQWKETEHFTTSNGNLVILLGSEQEFINGVGLILNKYMKNTDRIHYIQ